MRDCRNVKEVTTPPTVPLGLVETISAAGAAPSSANSAPNHYDRSYSHGPLVTGTPLSFEQSSLTASISSGPNVAQCINSAGWLGQYEKPNKVAFRTFPPSYSLSPSMRPIISQQWSIHCCVILFRIGSAVTLNRKKSPQSPSHYRKVGIGLDVSLSFPRYFQRSINAALFLTQAQILSQMRLALYCDIDSPRIIHRSAEIMRCVAKGSVDEVQRLFDTGKASPRDATIEGTTVLHLASKAGHLEMVRLLILEGADLNARNEDGITPLHCAVTRECNYDVARMLIENGADLANLTIDKRTPLHTFFNDTVENILLRDEWVEKLIPDSQGMSITHFLSWSSKTTPELFRRGVTHDSTSLWAYDSFGRTCLHFAASRGNIGLLKHLLEQADMTDLQSTDHRGRTPLHYAVQSKRSETIISLLASNGNLYHKDNSFQNTLHHAVWWKNLEAAKKLVSLDNGGVLLSPDKHGNMPSHLAQNPATMPLREFLEDLELEAKNTNLNKKSARQASSRANLGSQTKLQASPNSNFGVVTMMFVFCSAILLKLKVVRDLETFILCFVICLIFVWIRIVHV